MTESATPLEHRRGDTVTAPAPDHSGARIVHPRGDGGIIVSTPVPGASLEATIAASVPSGDPYLVVDAADVPDDTTFREAWTADFEGAPVSAGPEDKNREAAIERAKERTRVAFEASLRGPGDLA